jgi:hypothetical protein
MQQSLIAATEVDYFARDASTFEAVRASFRITTGVAAAHRPE